MIFQSVASRSDLLAGPIDWASELFEPLVDLASGVVSYVLSQRVALIQQSFYFTNPSLSDDGRYLWFYCAFPPSGDAYAGRLLGVADLHDQTVRYFPDTQFSDASPFVDSAAGDVYWISGLNIWRRGVDPKQPAERINTIPADLANHRRPLRIATHLTRSADGRRFGIDAQIGNEWIVGDLGVSSADPLRVWQRFDRCYNHGQFSPTDPSLLLIAQDGWHDASTGEKGNADDRIWLIRHGEKARSLFPGSPSNVRGHEWWQADGQHVWYVHYGRGTGRVNIQTGKDELIRVGQPQHSHCDREGKYVVSDTNSAQGGWRVEFFNRLSGRSVDLVTHMPKAAEYQLQYHVHPHPQFCGNDRFICYTRTTATTVDVALVEVDQLVALTN